MSNSTKYVGLDVSKSKIAIAIADEGRSESRYWGTIVHTKEAVRKLIQQLRKTEEVTLEVCYEAGPTGYVLYRWLPEMNISCTVIAPNLIPKRSGDRVRRTNGMHCGWLNCFAPENLHRFISLHLRMRHYEI